MCPSGFTTFGNECVAAPQPAASAPSFTPEPFPEARVEFQPPPLVQSEVEPPPTPTVPLPVSSEPVRAFEEPLPMPPPPARAAPLRIDPSRPSEPLPTVRAAPPEDPYLTRGVVDGLLLSAFDFYELMQGALLGLDFNVARGSSVAFGFGLGLGALGTAVGGRTPKAVVYGPVSLKLNVRLGGSYSDLIFRAGAMPNFIFASTSGFTVKGFGGAAVLISTGRPGRGALIGVDIAFGSGVVFLAQVGYVL